MNIDNILFKETPLHLAIKNNRIDIISALLEMGADSNLV